MPWYDIFKRHTRAEVSVGDAHLDIEGEPDFVERVVLLFIDNQRRAMVAAAQAAAKTRAIQGAPPPVAKHMPATVTSGPPHTWRRRGHFVRVHAIQRDIAKVYSVEAKSLNHGVLGRLVDMHQVANIYAEDPSLVRQMKSDQLTLWHRLMPREPDQQAG